MKKILILIMVLVAVKGMSQNTTDRKVKIGFQFTADFNNKPEYIGYGAGYYVTSTDDFNYTAGVVARFKVAKKFELGTGLLYSNKDMVGFVNCPACDMIPWSTELKQRYLEVPVTARFVVPGKTLGFYSEAGIITSAATTNDYDESPVGTSLNKFMLGGQVGLGGTLKLGRFDFSLGASFRRSFTNSYEDQDEYKLTSLGVNTAVYYRL